MTQSQTQKTEVEKYRGLTIMKGVNRYGEFYYVKEKAPSFDRNLGFLPFIPIGRTLEEIRRNVDEVYERIRDNLVYWAEADASLLKTLCEGAGEVVNYLIESVKTENAGFIVFVGDGYYKPARLFEDVYYYYNGVFVSNPKELGIKGIRLLRRIRESLVPDEVKSKVKAEYEDDIEKVVLAVNKRGKVYILAYVRFAVRTRDDELPFKLIRVPKEILGEHDG